MRLAARSREQDKLELELPGLRAGIFLLARISVAIGNTPNSGKIFKEFEARGFDKTTLADFVQQVIDTLPSTVDFVRREDAAKYEALRREHEILGSSNLEASCSDPRTADDLGGPSCGRKFKRASRKATEVGRGGQSPDPGLHVYERHHRANRRGRVQRQPIRSDRQGSH